MIVHLVLSWLNHKPSICSLKLLVIRRESLLTPAELDEAELVVLAQILKNIPENLNAWGIHCESTSILCVALEELEVDLGLSTDPDFEVSCRYH